MKNLKILLVGALLCFAPQLNASPLAGEGLNKIAGDGWEILGRRMVNMGVDHDEIPVTVTDGIFTKVKLVIRKAPLFLNNMNIVFGNGENKNVVFKKNFPAGSTTRIIDLPGNKRIIKKVNLNYSTKNWNGNGRAVVVLWGKH